MLSLELLVHRRLVDHADVALSRLRQLDEILRMAPPQLVGLPAPFELLERVLTDRLEHREPAVRDAAEQAAVDERRENRKHVDALLCTHRLDCVDRAASGEHREPREQDALGLGEERVAPIERRAKRLLPARKIARAACEHVEHLFQPLHHPRRRQQLAARGRKLDREGQPVEPPADLRDIRRAPLRQLEGWVDGAQTGHEQANGVVGGELLERRRRAAARRLQRWDRVLVLPAETQRRAARGEHGQSWSLGEQLRYERRPREHVLEVVEQQQDASVAQVIGERIGGGAIAFLDLERDGDRRRKQRRVGDGSEVDEHGAVAELS